MKLKEEAEKVHKVISSCKTKDQFKIANKLFMLWYDKWKMYASNLTFSYYVGMLTGLIQGRLLEFNKNYKPKYDTK